MTARCHGAGFSLVELMVALAITLIVLTGVGRAFVSTGHGYRLQDSLARLQETGRYVLETLATDLRRAGYWGGITELWRVEDVTPAGIARDRRVAHDDGSCSDPSWALRLDRHVFGLDDTRRGYPCLGGGTGSGDVLVVRYQASWPVGGAATPAFQPRHYYLRTSAFEGRLFRGADQAAHPVNGQPAQIAELVARAYYVRAVPTDACARQATVPALYRTALANGRLAAGEVARGVEQIQVRYGIDDDDDDAVDRYVDAPPAGDTLTWSRVRAVRFWVLIRGECPETGHVDTQAYPMGNVTVTPGDTYRRALYAQTVTLRNRGLRP